jgi:hypothetical protein
MVAVGGGFDLRLQGGEVRRRLTISFVTLAKNVDASVTNAVKIIASA